MNSITRQQKVFLKSYIVFASVAFALSVALLVSRKTCDGLVVFLGWPIVGLVYGSSIRYAILPFFSERFESKSVCARVLFWDMVILVIYGLVMLLISLGGSHDNIYLDMTRHQFVWTILFPLLFCFVIRFSFNDVFIRNSKMNDGKA